VKPLTVLSTASMSRPVSPVLIAKPSEGYGVDVVPIIVGRGPPPATRAILGALIQTTITYGGNLLGIDAFTLEIAIGALIAIAVWLDKFRFRGRR
jgi:hypothetical protein